MKAIVVKYHCPANHRGSRYSASTQDQRIYIPVYPELNSDDNKLLAAIKLCKKFNWKYNKLVEGTLPNRDTVFVFNEYWGKPSMKYSISKLENFIEY